jgi:hypothetical protein
MKIPQIDILCVPRTRFPIDDLLNGECAHFVKLRGVVRLNFALHRFDFGVAE